MASLSVSRVSRTLKVFFSAAAIAALVPARAPAATPNAPKLPLAYPAYDSYALVRGTTISADGRYVAYALIPEDGDPTLVVHDFVSGTDLREPRGMAPQFTADAKAVVYVYRAPNDEIDKARLANKKPSDFPPNGLGIVELPSGKNTTVDLVKSFAVARDAGSTIVAYARATPTPLPSGAKPSASPSALATESPTRATASSAAPVPTASPSASASPDDLHKKNDGSDFVIRELGAGREATVAHVDEYAVSHDGAYVAYATQSKDGKNDAL